MKMFKLAAFLAASLVSGMASAATYVVSSASEGQFEVQFTTGAQSTVDEGYDLITSMKVVFWDSGEYRIDNILFPLIVEGSAFNPLTGEFINHMGGDTYGDSGFAELANRMGSIVFYGRGSDLASVALQFMDDGFIWDEGTGSLEEVAAAVPEPASWAMMIAGFGLVGGAMRRRVRRVAA